jgi:diguanylate cyclase (GGDEF)-like protein
MQRAVIPRLFSSDLAVGMVIAGYSFAWMAGRLFRGRRVRPELCFIGPAIWFVACRMPPFSESFDPRVILAALILASYCLLTAKEFSGGDGYPSRYPIAVAMAVHAVMLVTRVPLALSEMHDPTILAFRSPSFDLIAVEALVFSQAIAFLFVSLTKERVEARLRTAALTDSLTGLPNRRALFDFGRSMIGQSTRHRRPISIVVFDLDGFKQINDTFGHPVGDIVIRKFSNAARNTLRLGDQIGRIGGEEFAAILPDANRDEASVAARRLMTAFANLAANVEGCRTEATASAGIATCEDGSQSLEEMLSAADHALYEGKRRGRDSLRIAPAKSQAPIPLSCAS